MSEPEQPVDPDKVARRREDRIWLRVGARSATAFRASKHHLYRENSGGRLQQGGVAGDGRTEDTDDFTCKDVKVDIREHHLVDKLLGDRINAQDLILCFTG